MENSYNTEPFLRYILMKKIEVVESFPKDELINKVEKENVIDQIYLINEFHNKAIGYDNFLGNRIQDKRGRIIEQYKISARKLKREYKEIIKKTELNSFEKILKKYGMRYLNRAEKSIKSAYENNYLGLLKRSMDRSEVCLGNTYFKNLRKNENLEIVSIQNVCYDMVEMDLIYLLNKAKKKNRNLDLSELVDEFCYVEKLGQDSKKFIEALLTYPNDFIRCFMRYKKDRNILNQDKYKKRLEKIVLLDKQYSLERR